MTVLKSETAENASHYEQESTQKEKREGKTQIEAKGCCCLGQRKHLGNLAAGQFREGSHTERCGVGMHISSKTGVLHHYVVSRPTLLISQILWLNTKIYNIAWRAYGIHIHNHNTATAVQKKMRRWPTKGQRTPVYILLQYRCLTCDGKLECQ